MSRTTTSATSTAMAMATGRAMDLDGFALHRAAMRGEDGEVRRIVDLGEDVNTLDSAGRTVVTCAIVGEKLDEIVDASDASHVNPGRLDALRILLRHPDISLYTLNAPQAFMRGVTPLGMAAWLNWVEAVQTLLEESAETVSVDGMDAHGATALMYAARDGSLAVVQQLLSHGARPDFRDANHRTSIQFSLAHPQILWLCEAVLRRHRWRESQSIDGKIMFSDSDQLLTLAAASLIPLDTFTPPPLSMFTCEATSRLTQALIQAIRSSDLSFLYSLLFMPPPSPTALYPITSPVLVNRPDSKGWSPIHHCASLEQPSINVLDALYCAGADVSLFTTHEHYTPLHCLARSARQSGDQFESDSSLYQFAVHIIRNLRAPLSARDKREETCIHIAAEHGESLDLLLAFLDCDITGSVRLLRNARGLTPLEVAKPDFRAAFGADADKFRPSSRVSLRTIRPTSSFASISSFSHRVPVSDGKQTDSTPIVAPLADFDISFATNQLLTNMHFTSPSLEQDTRPADADHLESLVRGSVSISANVIRHFRACTEDVAQDLRDAYAICDSLGTLLDKVKSGLEDKLSMQWSNGLGDKKRNRDSEDSHLTAVSTDSGYLEVSGLKRTSMQDPSPTPLIEYRHVSVLTDLPVFDNVELGSRSNPSPDWLDSFNSDSASYITNGHEVEREPAEEHVKVDKKPRSPTKKRTKDEAKTVDEKAGKRNADGLQRKISGASKLKAWLKKKILPDRHLKLEIVLDIEDDGRVGREVKEQQQTSLVHRPLQNPRVPTIKTPFHIALAAASRDLESIRRSAASVDHFIEVSRQSISRAERIVQRALKKRRTYITELRLRSLEPSSDDPPHSPDSAHSSDFSHSSHSSHSTRSRPTSSAYSFTRPDTADTQYSGSSARSSRLSFASTLGEGDDEDTRALRRLLLRKIEASVSGALDEIDKVTSWLRIVKETIRSVKRRAYL